MVNTILTAFRIEGHDAETIARWFEIYFELAGFEVTWLEQSNTRATAKMTKCVWKTAPKDLSDCTFNFANLATKTINPKATFNRPKAMCAGDSHCEYVWKIE